MKWRMPFITLLLGCGIAQADFLDEMASARSEDYKFKLDLQAVPSQTGVHGLAEPAGEVRTGGQGLSMNSRSAREWYQSAGGAALIKSTARDNAKERR